MVGILLAPLARRDKLGEAVWTVTGASVGLAEALHPRYGLLSNANIGLLTEKQESHSQMQLPE